MIVFKSILNIAIDTLKKEKKTIEDLIPFIEGPFEEAVKAIYYTKGKLIITGIGKSAIIGKKIVATLNSTGTIATFLHSADAIHGDLGIIHPDDTVLCISKSGNSPEIQTLIPILNKFGNTLIGMTANPSSILAKNSQYLIYTPVSEEADKNNLAPTCSTIAQMAMGDAVAMCLAELNQFDRDKFAKFHPGGQLGKELLTRVKHLMIYHDVPKVYPSDNIEKAILEMTAKRLGATAVLNDNDDIIGIITDGDLRRMLMQPDFSLKKSVVEVMSQNPICITEDEMATQALKLMQEKSITQLIVLEKNQYKGMIHLHDLIKEGFLNQNKYDISDRR
ncbi:KpsF/GutQ family sugar-phosphate isomerase [Membranihabitans marinus]|uniref:KpsF/GutQ family sugar-phosphate isomerase n=1 Tax=Membranihabitans marinus TaxID=1227546 RepID=UPI001F0020D3|nr:KpsF/GutQ family sugar-phosphate isomerase [Membranihabitans marinus]